MFSIDVFPTESITLRKRNGQVIDHIKALVDGDTIHIDDITVSIEDGDYMVRNLPNGDSEIYLVTDCGFFKGNGLSFPDHYQTKVRKISKSEMEQTMRVYQNGNQKKPRKLFISHSSKDKEYMVAFVELLEDIGMPDGSIVCSSVPGHGIPGGAETFVWLREQFLQCDLRVIFALSHNYYESAASLNEMGAAWLTKATDTLLLLPGFDFGDIRGCIDPTEIGIKLEGSEDELKHRLGELKDTLIFEHSLTQFSGTRWERRRDEFINKVKLIEQRMKEQQGSDNDSTDTVVPDRPFHAVASQKLPSQIPVEAAFLLVYAADGNGRILKVSDLGVGTTISTGLRQFMANDSARESARWQEALDFLISNVWVKQAGRQGVVFEVTGTGYDVADMLKENMGIDTSREPLDELKEFER